MKPNRTCGNNRHYRPHRLPPAIGTVHRDAANDIDLTKSRDPRLRVQRFVIGLCRQWSQGEPTVHRRHAIDLRQFSVDLEGHPLLRLLVYAND